MLYPVAHIAAAAAGLAIYVLATHAGKQRRPPSAAIAWVVGMIGFPYAALPLFLLFGSRKFVRPDHAPHARSRLPAPVGMPAWASRLSSGLSLPPPRHNVRIALLDDGPAALDALIGVIGSASHRLDLCTFLFADDPTGRRVADALAASAGRGCQVRLLLDGVGGMRMSRDLRRRLAGPGVAMRRFMPPLHDPRRGRGNLRNHRKLAIADGYALWSGGRNIADEYFVDCRGREAWFDLSFVIEGELVSDAIQVFERDWEWAGGFRAKTPAANVATPMPWAIGRRAETAGALAQLIPSGPDQATDTFHAMLLNAIYEARTRILAATPYFVPDESLLQALLIACRRGVRVSLLIPARSNHRLPDWARERDLRELSAAGADIRLLPSMLHAKMVVVDEAVALCGSANLDGRSLFLNYELSTAFYEQQEIDGFARWHARSARQASAYVSRPPPLARDIVEGLVRAVGFQL